MQLPLCHLEIKNIQSLTTLVLYGFLDFVNLNLFQCCQVERKVIYYLL